MLDKEPANRPASSDLGAALRAVLRPLLARHRAGAGASILGRTTPMKAPPSGGTIPMAATYAAPSPAAASSRAGGVPSRGDLRPQSQDAPSDSMREALPPPAPFDDGGAGARVRLTPPPTPATARDPAAATLRSVVRAPVTMPMPVRWQSRRSHGGQPVERPAAPVEHAGRARRAEHGGGETIRCWLSVVLGLGAAGTGWFAVGRDLADRARDRAGRRRRTPWKTSGPPTPASGRPSTSASTSATAAAPPVESAAPRTAPAHGHAPAPRRGKIPVP